MGKNNKIWMILYILNNLLLLRLKQRSLQDTVNIKQRGNEIPNFSPRLYSQDDVPNKQAYRNPEKGTPKELIRNLLNRRCRCRKRRTPSFFSDWAWLVMNH